MSVTLTTMRYFVEVAKTENVTAAAARLYTAQSNLSKSISGLERTLGVELFRRDGRYVRLTGAGQLLYREWSQALEQIDRSILRARQMEQAKRESLSVGILSGLSVASDAPQQFRELQRRHPNVTVRLERGELDTIWHKFEAGDFDLIVTSELHDSPHPQSPALGRQVLHTCSGVLAINADNPMAAHSALTLPMLREESFVALSREHSPEGYQVLRDACRQAGFEPRITQEAFSIETLMLYVEMGVGAAIMGGDNRLTSNANIRLIPLEDLLFDTAVYWHADPPSPTVLAILSVIK